MIKYLLAICVLTSVCIAGWFGNEKEEEIDYKYEYVTCGSIIKLKSTYHKKYLHSQDVKYGTGSGQQSVTGYKSSTDAGSYWRIKGVHGGSCKRGEPIVCPQKIRLENVATGRNLHSHLFHSPLSQNQEISCFGEDGVGDTGDNWEVECSGKWRRDGVVKFKHVDTSYYLTMSGNEFGRPISGQNEVVGMRSAGSESDWAVREGLYIIPVDKDEKTIIDGEDDEKDEL